MEPDVSHVECYINRALTTVWCVRHQVRHSSTGSPKCLPKYSCVWNIKRSRNDVNSIKLQFEENFTANQVE